MIILKKPYIKSTKTKSRLNFEFSIDNEEKKIWFEVDNQYKSGLCDDRIDAIFVGLLSYALRNGHDIKSDSYISEDILYKVNEYLIPSLVKYGKNLQNIKIDIKTKKEVSNQGMVGTGCSCGIDSFHSILGHYKTKKKSYNLTHLCINNVGAFNECYKESGIDEVRKERIKKSRELADEIGLPLIITNSNFQNEVYQQHSLTHTYSSVFAILCMQKFWSKYYYGSSGMDFENFGLQNNDEVDCSKYELLSLDCFSTSNLKIFSEGGAKSRLEKTKFIYDNKYVHKYLHVCTIKATNCGVCPKCMRTILTLYCFNDDMSKYKNVFDIDYFEKHKDKYFLWLCQEHDYSVAINEPIYYELLNKNDFKEFVDNYNDSKKKDEVTEEHQYNYFEDEYYKIINSKTFKLGNAILYFPRKIKGILKK